MDQQPQADDPNRAKLAELEQVVGKFHIHDDGGSPAVWRNEEVADAQRQIDKIGLWRWQTRLFQWMRESLLYFTGGPFGSVAREFGKYFGKPIIIWLPCAVIGLTLQTLEFFVPGWDRHAGMPLGENEGYLRVGMILLGAFFIFLAWPDYRGKDWNPEEDAEREEAHEQFAEALRKRMNE